MSPASVVSLTTELLFASEVARGRQVIQDADTLLIAAWLSYNEADYEVDKSPAYSRLSEIARACDVPAVLTPAPRIQRER